MSKPDSSVTLSFEDKFKVGSKVKFVHKWRDGPYTRLKTKTRWGTIIGFPRLSVVTIDDACSNEGLEDYRYSSIKKIEKIDSFPKSCTSSKKYGSSEKS